MIAGLLPIADGNSKTRKNDQYRPNPALTEIVFLILKFSAPQKMIWDETPTKVLVHHGMKKYVNKICLLCLVPEILLFVYILGQNSKMT